jgi:5,5'-dehydrodivanillate O-demethylase
MLTASENARLTRVGPDTPMGRLLRHYWHPIAASGEFDSKPVKPVRILGEDLVLYRDTSNRLGLVGERCPHRLVRLEFGYPVAEGLRCPYHGWTFDGTGACVAQPAEPPESTFKDKIHITSYPVQELGGIVFAYLGPAPAPLLPRWGPLVAKSSNRQISFGKVPANWLQTMEMSPDQAHVEWVHGHFAQYVLERVPGSAPVANADWYGKRAIELDTAPYEYGLLRRRVMEGGSRADESWALGQPMLFPNAHMTSVAGTVNLSWRVPDDDTHTTDWIFHCTPAPNDGNHAAPDTGAVPYKELHSRDSRGVWDLTGHYGQDHLIFVAQGEVFDRTDEHLTGLDAGVLAYRNLLATQLALFEAGEATLNVFRDPYVNANLELPVMGR